MRIDRSPLLVSAMAAVACAYVAVPLRSQDNPRRKAPNIVVIYADDHAEHAISAYGSRINTTPHIDRLARDGMRFTQSFVGNSICGPARATILTGLHAHAHGQEFNGARFRNELPTWPKLLQGAGYRTAMIGKWHVGATPTGFDHAAVKTGAYYNSSFRTENGNETSLGHVTDEITRRSIAWMRTQCEAEEPFAIWICHAAAHRTWMPATRHLELFDGEDIPEPPTLFDDYATRGPGAASAQMRVSRDLFPAYDLQLPVTGQGVLDKAATRLLNAMNGEQREAWDAAFGPRNEAYAKLAATEPLQTRWKYQRYIKNYLRCVAGLDESVGQVRAFLKDRGVEDNTIVIYTSDQGFFLGDHGYYDKRWMYEEALRTPMIVHWPGTTKPNTTCDALVQNIDVAPTLLAMADCQTETKMHGRSLVPLLKGEVAPGPWRDAIYYHYLEDEEVDRTSHLVAKHYGVRTRRYKLIYFYELKTWEFYDLAADPHETKNLYGSPDVADIVTSLEKRLTELRREYGA